MANTYSLISATTLSGNASTVALSAIPQTYTDLVIKFSLRISSGNPLNGYNLRFNNDSSAIYRSTFFAYDGGLYQNYDTGSNAFASVVANGGTSVVGAYTLGEIYMPNYTGTSPKQFSYSEAAPNTSTSSIVKEAAGLYANSTGITSVNFSNATFVAGSTFYIYGIKNS